MFTDPSIDERDIGHGIVIAKFTFCGELEFLWKHHGCRCGYPVFLQPDPRSTGHRALAGSADDLEHLTVEGSLLCPVGCGAHGLVVVEFDIFHISPTSVVIRGDSDRPTRRTPRLKMLIAAL